jgi:hypothetical protein
MVVVVEALTLGSLSSAFALEVKALVAEEQVRAAVSSVQREQDVGYPREFPTGRASNAECEHLTGLYPTAYSESRARDRHRD